MLFKLNGSHEQLFAFERIVTVWSIAPDLALCLPLGVSANANIFKMTLSLLVSHLVDVLSVLC